MVLAWTFDGCQADPPEYVDLDFDGKQASIPEAVAVDNGAVFLFFENLP
jgi:hypothetical protein